MTNFTRIVALRQEIEAIFQATSGNFPDVARVEQDMETLVNSSRRGEIKQAAECVIALLSLDLDVLQKAALLSLMVRAAGQRKFDPVAAYVLEKRAAYATVPG